MLGSVPGGETLVSSSDETLLVVGQQVFFCAAQEILASEQDFAVNPSSFLAAAWKPEAPAPFTAFLFLGLVIRPVENFRSSCYVGAGIPAHGIP